MSVYLLERLSGVSRNSIDVRVIVDPRRTTLWGSTLVDRVGMGLRVGYL